MSKKLIHTYPVSHFANSAKVDKLLSLYSGYSSEFRKLLHAQHRRYLQGDITALSSLGSTKEAKTPLSQSYYQGCKARACEALSSYVTHLHERALRLLANSSVREAHPSLYRQTLYLLKCQSRLIRYHIPMQLHLIDDYGTEVSVPNLRGRQELVSQEARTLYCQLLRQARKQITFPDVKAPRLVLDSRTGILSPAKREGHFAHWLAVSTLVKGQRVQLPLRLSEYAQRAPGEFANSLEIQVKQGKLHVSLWKKATPEQYKEWHFKSGTGKAYPSKTVALDFGLCTLLASSEGNCYGRYWLDRLTVYDKQLTALAAQRQRLGLKTRSPKYDSLINRIRGFIKTEVGRIVNQFVRERPDLEIVVLEKLRFSSPHLSRRLNRIIQNCGLRKLKDKFQELAVVYGFSVVEVNPAYTSQTCSHCGWVSRGNRPSQKVFKCELCGKTCHADFNASRNLYERFILGEDKPSKQAILAMLKANFHQKLAGNIGDGVIAIPRLRALIGKRKSWVSSEADKVQLAEHLAGLTGRRSSHLLFQLGLPGDAQSDFLM